MVRKPLIVSWGLALCATGALMATGCKSTGWSMPGSKLLGWNKQDTVLASNDPVKPPSQLDIPGPADTEIASAETVSGTGYPSGANASPYGGTYPPTGGAAVATNQPAAGPSNWNSESPAVAASPYGAQPNAYGAPQSPYGAQANPYAQEQVAANPSNPYGAAANEQFGPPAGSDWNRDATAQVTQNPYAAPAPTSPAARTPAATGANPSGDFNTGSQFASNANASFNDPVASPPNYPTTDFPAGYPVDNASANMPTSPYVAATPKAPPAFEEGSSDFQPAGDIGPPPTSSFDSQAVARADSSFGATKRPPASGSAGDVIPAPANLTASRGGYAPGSTGFGGGTVVADQRGAPTGAGSNYAPNQRDSAFEPNGGSFAPTNRY